MYDDNDFHRTDMQSKQFWGWFVGILVAFFIIMMLLYTCACNKPLTTDTEIINNNWTFALGDYQDAQNADFDDSEWQIIGLPHSFGIPYFMSRDFYTGYGWYRKKINLNSDDLEKRILLQFDGVFQEAEVFVNGKLTGSHIGGYTGFVIDITDNAHQGENLVAVRVNNIWKPDVAPRAGEHQFNGGIYRTVKLLKKNPSHFAWCGVQLITQGLKESNFKSARIFANLKIENQSKESINFGVELKVLDTANNVIAIASTNKGISPNAFDFAQIESADIENITLWSPDNPYLYTVECTLSNGGEVLDKYTTPLGFRHIEWTADKGLFINGEHLYLQGANVHQDHAGWCDAVTEEGIRRDVRLIKEAGFNMIRGSHYPHSPVFADECSRQ